MSACPSIDVLPPTGALQASGLFAHDGTARSIPLTAARAPRVDLRLLGVLAAGFCVFLSVYSTQALLPMLASVFHASALHASLTVTATTVAVAMVLRRSVCWPSASDGRSSL